MPVSGRSPRRFYLAGLLCLAVCVGVCTGCVDLSAAAVVAANGSCRLTVEYRVPSHLEALDQYRSASVLPFPLERDSLLRQISLVEGVTLARWSREDTAEECFITAELRFESLTAFARFLEPYGNRIQYTETDERKELSITVASGIPLPEDAAAWVRISYPEYAVDLSVTLPVRASSVSLGTLSQSGLVARYSEATRDIVLRSDALEWTIEWQQ